MFQLEAGLTRNRVWVRRGGAGREGADRRLQTQSRLTAGNLEDELNAAIGHARALLADLSPTDTAPEILATRALLTDADKVKKVPVFIIIL